MKKRLVDGKLRKVNYIKVADEDIDYFIKESCYTNKYDGDIVIEFITEETYLKKLFSKVKAKESFIETDIENAEKRIKKFICKSKGV